MTPTYRGFAIGLALGLAFSLGCAAAVTVIPPARAQAGSVERWEYLEIHHGWDRGRWANEAGAEGWEMVSYTGLGLGDGLHYFKRRLP